jgi:hypothetical protein
MNGHDAWSIGGSFAACAPPHSRSSSMKLTTVRSWCSRTDRPALATIDGLHW